MWKCGSIIYVSVLSTRSQLSKHKKRSRKTLELRSWLFFLIFGNKPLCFEYVKGVWPQTNEANNTMESEHVLLGTAISTLPA